MDAAYAPDGLTALPGERLIFGVHRLPERERWCPAWPVNPKHTADAAYRAMLNRERKNPTPPSRLLTRAADPLRML